MTITFDINAGIGLASPKTVSVEVCDIQASGDEMRFAADLTAAVKDFALNYKPPKEPAP